MARARNIKPGFFRNADLAELPMEARMLFIGLWTLADRAGRMEDRPKQIKMEIFPADSVDVDSLLNQLAATNMVARYEFNGKRYLQVVNFAKHQNPHRDEKASTLPDIDGHIANGVAIPREHHANTVQAPCNAGSSTVAIVLNPEPLIPDSLIPDSLIPEKKKAQAPTLPGVSAELLADYLQVRKAKKAGPLTQTAIDGLLREAEKAGITLEAAVAFCCEAGWQGFNAGWYAERTARPGPVGAVVATGGRILNKQEILEASNDAVVQRYLAKENHVPI